MEYVYAALILHESGAEINEQNLTGILEAGEVDVEESRVKALVAALEDVDIEEAVEEAAAVPAAGSGGGAAAAEEETEEAAEETEEAAEETDTDADAEEADADAEEDEEADAEGLGDLFG